jgi:hypothetical protein
LDIYGDLETFMHDVGGDRIFQLLIYKKVYTPYEQEQKFRDESVYTDNSYQDIKIKEVIPLDGDILLGVQLLFDYEDLDSENPRIEYHKLSDIELSYNPATEKEYLYEGEYSEDGD